MPAPEQYPVGCVLMQTSGFRVVQVADDTITITRVDRLYRLKSLLGVFVSCFAGGIGFMTVIHARGSALDFPAQAIGYVVIAFFGMLGINSLLGGIGLGGESWYVTRNLVRYRDGFYRRKSVNRIVELRKDSVTGRCELSACKIMGSDLFWDKQYFDLSGTIEERSALGRLISQFSGWRYVETETELGRWQGEH